MKINSVKKYTHNNIYPLTHTHTHTHTHIYIYIYIYESGYVIIMCIFPLGCPSLLVVTFQTKPGAWCFHSCVCVLEDFSETQKFRRGSVSHWDVVEKFSQLYVVRSFQSWKNGFFQLVELLLYKWMSKDILYFLGDFAWEGLYNGCEHNS